MGRDLYKEAFFAIMKLMDQITELRGECDEYEGESHHHLARIADLTSQLEASQKQVMDLTDQLKSGFDEAERRRHETG